jgi:hypothetical protein
VNDKPRCRVKVSHIMNCTLPDIIISTKNTTALIYIVGVNSPTPHVLTGPVRPCLSQSIIIVRCRHLHYALRTWLITECTVGKVRKQIHTTRDTSLELVIANSFTALPDNGSPDCVAAAKAAAMSGQYPAADRNCGRSIVTSRSLAVLFGGGFCAVGFTIGASFI